MRPLGFKDISHEAMSLDKMPNKSIKKWKRKDRQKARKRIRKELAAPKKEGK